MAAMMMFRLGSLPTARLATRTCIQGSSRALRLTRSIPEKHLARFASSASTSLFTDPTDAEAVKALEEGTHKLEDGDLEGATECYERSVEIRRTAHTLYNLGVIRYHAKDYDAAIEAWKESISLEPRSPDAHTNLASAYIMSPISRPDLALEHLRTAHELSPDDPEISFNLAAVLEASGQLEEALEYYEQSRDRGIERAAVNARNVGGKIVGKRVREQTELALQDEGKE